jgi:AcrR family transcriptional regulator
LLSAALYVLEHEGYEGFTIEAVAKRAGSSKVTIYRRWPSAAALLLAALAQHGAETVPASSTGPLERDLRKFFRVAFHQLNGRLGILLRSLMAEAQGSEEFRKSFRDEFIAQRRASLGTVLLAARARGELAAGTNLELLLDFLFGAMWYRLLVAHAPLDARFIDALVDLARRYR